MRILLTYLAIGLSIGCVSGALGIGGGVLLVPALTWLCRLDPPVAAGTSLAVLVLPITLPAAWKAYVDQRVELEAAVWIAASFALGGYLGSALVPYLPERTLRLGFGLVLLFLSVRYVLSSSSEAGVAAAGLVACGFALLARLVLSRLGRRHLPSRSLGETIRVLHEQGHGNPDYHI